MRTKGLYWHSLELDKIKNIIKADFDSGLSSSEAESRLKKFGRNEIKERRGLYYPRIIFNQLKSPLVFVLAAAGFITLFLKDYTDSFVIFLAVLINTAVGSFQEGRASRAFEKLRSSQERYSTVLRDGSQKIVESTEIVPGDIILLKMGDMVPADCRLIDEKGLEVNESVLTGEWLSVDKEALERVAQNSHITERKNMVWMGTLVTEGWAKAVAVATGKNTELGRIASLIEESGDIKTPLQKGIFKMARFLTLIILAALFLIVVFGILSGRQIMEMLILAVAVGVAAIPEGLIVAITVALALGMERILSAGGLVKNLSSAETLGSTSVILTDKTGTLTKAEMVVYKIMTLFSEKKEFKKREHKDRLQVLEMALFAADSFIENPEDELKEWRVRGSSVDRAIFMSSLESGINPIQCLKENPRLDYIPFDSERRYSASLNKTRAGNKVFILGAPELIMGFCEKIYGGGREFPLDNKMRDFMQKAYERETEEGGRILAVAYKRTEEKLFPHHDKDRLEKFFEKMVLGGLIAFHDPLREDAKQALTEAKGAGVRILMLTGDHLKTAIKVAKEAGLSFNPKYIEGEELEKMTEKEINKAVEDMDVFARLLPHQKLGIVKTLRSKGEVVAMTGDGVNDAPALNNADIGIALGSATEVAKEASDIILTNDSFSVIVKAIEEGRRMLDNIKKIVVYLLSTSFSEIILIVGAMLAGLPLPILPTQILWANIIEEGFMNFAFVFEPAEKDIMKRNPKENSSKNMISKSIKEMIAVLSIVTGGLLFGLFLFLDWIGYPIEEIRTVMFIAVSTDSIFFAFSIKSFKRPIWKINILSNYYLILSVLASLGLLLFALLVPFLQNVLSLVPFSLMEILFIILLGLLNLVVIEVVKYFLFEKKRKRG